MRSVSDSAVNATHLAAPLSAPLPTMAGSSGSNGVRAPPRTDSLDSAVSSMSSKMTNDVAPGPSEVAGLIKAAGSPEAVIQYLLKEKHSQSQQNAQLWRLVDKQRAMILGLNKDLERALKEKEKYRKKMKEVMSAHGASGTPDTAQHRMPVVPRVDVNAPSDSPADVPASPSNMDSDSVKHSPVDMAMAPYPITPPADQMSHGMPSAVGELLDPSHAMPKASEHALGQFDHEAEERVADAEKKASAEALDLPLKLGLPPPREPPNMPPPAPPSMTSKMEASSPTLSQFPPSAPPRKPPPAPLQLKKSSQAAAVLPLEEENDSDSDLDDLLEVDELPIPEKRGRRRTREEDDRDREIQALRDAEQRSLSKKSKKGSQKGTPKEVAFGSAGENIPASPRTIPAQPLPSLDNITVSLAGLLGGDEQANYLTAPLLSPGLPSSPRPQMNLHSSPPPLSPRGIGMTGVPLSPRAPRQAIPLPPNTPLVGVLPVDAAQLSSPKPLALSKTQAEDERAGSPASPNERTKIYKGFVTEEYPDLLLPPNALPSIEVKVASSRMRPSRASLISLTQLEEDPVFTLAVHLRSAGGELWRVEKDIVSLAKLDQKLKVCAAVSARTPDRSLFHGHAPAKLDARRIALNQYLEEVLNTPLDTPTAVELCKYLSTNTLAPNSDETGSGPDIQHELSSPKTSPEGRPYRSGYLTKRGKNFGGWKARFFVLDGPLLKYYETPGGAHLGTIKLQGAQIGKQSQPAQNNEGGPPASGSNNEELDNQYRHAFLVLEPKKKDSSSHVKHVLCAESDMERDHWVETLLRWIDYRDPEEKAREQAKAAAERQSKTSQSANPKRKTQSQPKPTPHGRAASQDGLIGISYEGTKQGDAPDGSSGRRNVSGTPDSQDRTMPPPPRTGSGSSRDAQAILEASSRGPKGGIMSSGPSMEEKKARKRSFFGFGPKTRSSTDDTDSLFGSSVGSTATQEYRGPPRQVFGAPLGDAVRFNGPVDVTVPLPSVVYRCIQYLDAKNAIREEGIFRLSGSNVVIKQLRERFNVEGDVNLLTDETYYDIHAVASLLKLYLRELPTTILTRDLHLQFLTVTEMSSHAEKIAALGELVQHLPRANDTLLRYLLSFLIKIINHADVNKMTVRNVGIVFSPTLNIPAPVFALLLQNYQGVFGIDPEEYELPVPGSDSDSRPSIEPQPRRPSNGGPSASPTRQRLMEMQQRSTPTPPPMAAGMASRQNAYDYQHGVPLSARPAYESGFPAPPNFDPNIVSRHQAAGYEQSYAPYEQGFAAKSKRRESSMMMGNVLKSQASNTRLRDGNRI